VEFRQLLQGHAVAIVFDIYQDRLVDWAIRISARFVPVGSAMGQETTRTPACSKT